MVHYAVGVTYSTPWRISSKGYEQVYKGFEQAFKGFVHLYKSFAQMINREKSKSSYILH